MKAILTIGPPGCGKSTWAYEQYCSGTLIVERDELREPFFEIGEKRSDSLEEKVTKNQMALLLSAIKSKRIDTIIVSDTNINPKTRNKLEKFFKENNVEVEYKIFLDCDYETICSRNKLREGWKRVPDKVMQDMYIRFREQFPKPAPAYDSSLPDCYLCDIDGTVAKNVGRSPFDWKRVGEDEPHSDVIDLLFDINKEIIYLSGRDSICYDETIQWLKKNVCINSSPISHYGIHTIPELYMRPEGSYLKDSCVKHDLFHKYIAGKYNVLGVFDDRDQVVKMWRSMGLRCYQVAEGNF